MRSLAALGTFETSEAVHSGEHKAADVGAGYIVCTAVVAMLTGSLLVGSGASAQGSLHQRIVQQTTQVDHTSPGFRSGSFVLAPIPIESPTIGTGMALGAAYLFDIDKGSDPSGIGLGGFKTNSGSQGYALGGKLNFGGGKWNIRGGVGEADLVYDFYVQGDPIEVSQSGRLGRIGGSYGLTDATSVGLDLQYIESDLSLAAREVPEVLEPDLSITSVTADFSLEYDTRDDTIYPTSGVNATLSYGWGTVSDGLGLGNFEFDTGRNFTRSLATFDFYLPVFKGGVIAGQAVACDVDRKTPFFQACLLGNTDAFRGYPTMQYIGDALASFQLEYRGRIGSSRFGYVGFASVGAVAADFSELKDADARFAGGIGGRFRVSHKFPVDLSVDFALNEDNETTTYVYVGQRF